MLIYGSWGQSLRFWDLLASKAEVSNQMLYERVYHMDIGRSNGLALLPHTT
jgi:hypothetical protein